MPRVNAVLEISPHEDIIIALDQMYMFLVPWSVLASFPGSPSFRAIIPRMTFDPPEGKAEGEPGRFCHMTRVMQRHPYLSCRRGRSGPWIQFHYLGSPSAFPSGGSKVIRGIIAQKEGKPENEASQCKHFTY